MEDRYRKLLAECWQDIVEMDETNVLNKGWKKMNDRTKAILAIALFKARLEPRQEGIIIPLYEHAPHIRICKKCGFPNLLSDAPRTEYHCVNCKEINPD